MLTFLQIAQFLLPSLVSLITDKNTIKNADEIRTKIEDAVKAVTGAPTPEEAQAKVVSDPKIETDLKSKISELALQAQKEDNLAQDAFNVRVNQDTDKARDTLLELLNKPDSHWIAITPSAISFIIVVGFFVLIGIMLFGDSFFPKNDKVIQIINILVGAAAAGFATVLNFWLGSSLGSRNKDASIALSTTVDQVKTLIDPKNPPPSGGGGGVGGIGRPSLSGGGSGPSGAAASGGTSATAGTNAVLPSLPASLSDVGRSTSPNTRNVLKTIPYNGIVAPIRYNNPGSQWPAKEASAFGQVGYGALKDGNHIALFPSPVNGAASNFDLLARNYVGMQIGPAGGKWTGSNSFGVPGYNDTDYLTKDMLDDPKTAIAFMKEIAKREAGKSGTLTDEQWGYAYGMFKAGSADAFLAKFGRAPTNLVVTVQPDGPTSVALEVLIARALEAKGYEVSRGAGEVNIVYIEGMDMDGAPNNDPPNKFNDLRCVVDFVADGTPRLLGRWQATTEPGYYYDRDHPMNEEGAARIEFNQFKAWRVGMHKGTQEALIQAAPVSVYRDLNRDMQRTGDKLDTGLFGINQHGGYDLPENNVGKASAGCLVGRLMAGQTEFMRIVKKDPRFVADENFIFQTAIFSAADVAKPEAVTS